MRIATYNTGLERPGPGILLRDITRGSDAQIAAVVAVIATVDPDVLLLQKFDYDYDLRALRSFATVLSQAGAEYPYIFALRPNTGMATGLDMDGNGRNGTPRDAQGYGRFAGQAGMALLSRLPVDHVGVRDFSDFLWRDLPGGIPPRLNGQAFPSEAAFSVQRLASTGHWDLPLQLPDGGGLHLWALHASPPVFDGAEDRNGRRNHDEAAFWLRYLDGQLPLGPGDAPFVLLGDFNLDTHDGDGRAAALRRLLSDPRLQDMEPESQGGTIAAVSQGGVNAFHTGNPAFDTADWPDEAGRPGNMRVDYVLPSAGLRVVNAGVYWPGEGKAAAVAEAASRHHMVWVDIAF